MDLSTFKTAALVDLFNAISPKPVSRFADRAAAEKRTAAAVATAGPVGLLARGICPGCGDRHNGLTAGRINDQGQEVDEHLLTCHMCGTEWNSNTGSKHVRAPRRSASAAIAASWADSEVRADRLDRCSVRVTNLSDPAKIEEFKSVGKAFKALNLPMGKHISFRMRVKAEGSADIAGYKFERI